MSRSMTAVVDRLAAETPNNVWLKVPSEGPDGQIFWTDITWAQLSKAVDTMARWIEEHLGLGVRTDDGEALGYTAINDIRYPIVILAALKTGYKSFLSSPRNSIEGHVSLLKATKCTKFVFSQEFQNLANALSASVEGLKAVEVPPLDVLLHTDPDAPPYQSRVGVGERMEARETVMILHSSGTTGLPKPIPAKSGCIGIVEKIQSIPNPDGRRHMHDEMYNSRLIVIMLPFFHAFGTNLLIRSIYHQGPLVLLPPGKPPTAELMLEAMEKTNPSAIACSPSILEDMSNLPRGIEAISKLEHIFYGGAPLALSCGDKLTKMTTLTNAIGSTEAFFMASYINLDPADWEYFEFNPESGAVMEPTPDPALAELVVKPRPDSDFVFYVHNFPDVAEWRTKDLFERHATKPTLWRYVGRMDDIMVLSNGEKINPVSFEKAVEGHPWVRSALMVGSGRFQAALVLDPAPEQVSFDTEAFIDQVWPWVEQANASYPAHGRVWRSMITLASPEKPFQRAPKGSVMRRATNQLYEKEIGLLYGKQDSDAGADGTELGDASTRDIVRSAVQSVLPGRVQDLTDSADLFGLGMDSLQVLQLSKMLGRELRGAPRTPCTPRTIYSNPSITQLTHTLSTVTATAPPPPPPPPPPPYLPRGEDVGPDPPIHALPEAQPRHPHPLGTQARDRRPHRRPHRLDRHPRHAPPAHAPAHAVRSPHLLPEPLIRRRRAAGVQLRRRRPGPLLPHQSHLPHHRPLPPHPRPPPTTYTALATTTTTIIHNAWPVNFNTPLAAFAPSLAGTRHLADLAAAAAAHVTLISSIGSVMNYPAVRPGGVGVVPEEFDADNSLPIRGQGYAESKHVAGCILHRAARVAGVRATVLRVGQVGGPMRGGGVWNRHEWLPSLIASSKVLGRIPRALGRHNDVVTWLPVDVAAEAVRDLALAGGKAGEEAECFNVVNPRAVEWAELVAAVQKFYSAREGRTIEQVSLGEWLDELNRVDATDDADKVERFPALKLLDFFQGLNADGGVEYTFSTDRAVEKSPAMAGSRPIDGGLMEKWLEGWAF
ncbi:hypothetical protein B0H67DRAFT_612024 [Lasiosphaeris hirsuta]|uniref:Polyketide synthase-like phosphopantetheine-binding domain-containing protein n=1 Tax=Lasiosphaeris hirsuta TaxID=260670 RepID=A0AA40A0U9_9PEZI|nr:hypothetical protein B0H67DRAFT_612024 [Lasiosphaeris hirsuta]